MNYKSAVAGLLCLGAVGCQKETVVRVVPMEYEQSPRTVYTTQRSYEQPIRYAQPRQTVYTTSYVPAVQTVVAPAPVVYGSRPVIVYDNPYRYNNVCYLCWYTQYNHRCPQCRTYFRRQFRVCFLQAHILRPGRLPVTFEHWSN